MFRFENTQKVKRVSPINLESLLINLKNTIMSNEQIKPFKPFTREQKQKQRKRLISDAELGDIDDSGKIRPSEKMVEVAEKEMGEDQGFYSEEETVNGIKLSIGWYDNYEEYCIYFPQAPSLNKLLRISSDKKMAEQVFTRAKQLAEQENRDNIPQIIKKVDDFISELAEQD